MKSFLFILLAFLLSLPSQAYVPRAKTIVGKMVLNNGRREYKIVREVKLESPDRQISAREVWTVAYGDKMKVKVTGTDPNNPWSFVILYGGKTRKTLSQKKKLMTFKKSPDFFEPLFHDRSSKSLLRRLVSHRFIPDWAETTPPPIYKDGKTKMTPEPFINLTPMEGRVSFQIGSLSDTQGASNNTLLWVEQDSFLIRKGRLRSNAEFVNTQFQTYTGGLKLPSEQRISWGDKLASIKILTAERTRTGKKDWKLNTKDNGSIPVDPLIKEFYSRFR